MHTWTRLTIAVLALMPLGAAAQATENCPELPANAGMHWERMGGPGFMFCRALQADGSEAFAVTVSRDSPFEPVRKLRAEEATVAGQQTHWYRSEIAGSEQIIARETLVQVDPEHVAHVSLRARDQQEKEALMRQVEALRFGGSTRLSAGN